MPTINTAVTQRNCEQVLEIADLAEALGAYCFNPFILVNLKSIILLF